MYALTFFTLTTSGGQFAIYRACYNVSIWLSIKNITRPDPAKFMESTEGSGLGLRNLSENDDLSVPECKSVSGSNR